MKSPARHLAIAAALLLGSSLSTAHYFLPFQDLPAAQQTPITLSSTPPVTTVTARDWVCINAANAVQGGAQPTRAAIEAPCGALIAGDGVSRRIAERVTSTTTTTQQTLTPRASSVGGTTLQVSPAHAQMLVISGGGGGSSGGGDPPGGDPPAIVQNSFADDDATSSLNIPFDTNVTAGSTLVAWVRMGTDGTQTVTYDGQTFTKLHEDGWLGWDCEVYGLANANGGSSTVNVSTTSGPDVIRVITAEFDGMPSALNLDDFASDTGSGTTANAGQVTAIEDGSLVLMGFCVDSDPEGYDADPPMTLISEPTSDKVAASWAVINAGNITPTMGLNSGDWAALTVVLGP